ncbi:short chain dehydrogenase [Hyaloraphidium curvatum]|nr:short chain dehydrogenase [Hyaloraphidium curvatum]
MSLRDKVVFVSGGTRGIGLACAVRLAREGARVVITGKTTDPHSKLPGTIYSAAEECKAAGAPAALGLPCDIRSEEQVFKAVQAAVDAFGGIDILINNASALHTQQTEQLSVKEFDLVHQINNRGTWLVTKACIPHLKASARAGRNPKVITMCPPITTEPFAIGAGYWTAKTGMSLQVLGHAEELRAAGVAVNGLWPRKFVFTAAVRFRFSDTSAPYCYHTGVQADAVYTIVMQPADYTGNLTIDTDVVASQGIDPAEYKVDPSRRDEELRDCGVDPKYRFRLPQRKVLERASGDPLAGSRSSAL